MIPDELREKFAALVHRSWAGWQQHVHDCGRVKKNGSIVISAEDVARWERQIAASYEELPESEKNSDRVEVYFYWPLIEAYIAELKDRLDGAERENERMGAALQVIANAIYAQPDENGETYEQRIDKALFQRDKEIEELVAALKQVEWHTLFAEDICPFCRRNKRVGHLQNCMIGQALEGRK